MATIPQKVLRNQVGEVLRRVEAGETLTVTVAGRPVAELSPASGHRWVPPARLAGVWATPTPEELEKDLRRFGAALMDPFAAAG